MAVRDLDLHAYVCTTPGDACRRQVRSISIVDGFIALLDDIDRWQCRYNFAFLTNKYRQQRED